MKFALEHQNPLIAASVISTDRAKTVYPETHYSLLSVDGPGVLLWALKPAEEGLAHGITARLWNLNDIPATATLALDPAVGVSSAHHTTHIETNLAPVALTSARALPASFTRQQIQTYRLRLGTPRLTP